MFNIYVVLRLIYRIIEWLGYLLIFKIRASWFNLSSPSNGRLTSIFIFFENFCILTWSVKFCKLKSSRWCRYSLILKQFPVILILLNWNPKHPHRWIFFRRPAFVCSSIKNSFLFLNFYHFWVLIIPNHILNLSKNKKNFVNNCFFS